MEMKKPQFPLKEKDLPGAAGRIMYICISTILRHSPYLLLNAHPSLLSINKKRHALRAFVCLNPECPPVHRQLLFFFVRGEISEVLPLFDFFYALLR